MEGAKSCRPYIHLEMLIKLPKPIRHAVFKISLLFITSSTCNLIIIGGCCLDMFKLTNRYFNVYLSEKKKNLIVIVHIIPM